MSNWQVDSKAAAYLTGYSLVRKSSPLGSLIVIKVPIARGLLCNI